MLTYTRNLYWSVSGVPFSTQHHGLLSLSSAKKDLYEEHHRIVYLLTGHCVEERSEKSLDFSLFHEHPWR